jgi:hypothetical protein
VKCGGVDVPGVDTVDVVGGGRGRDEIYGGVAVGEGLDGGVMGIDAAPELAGGESEGNVGEEKEKEKGIEVRRGEYGRIHPLPWVWLVMEGTDMQDKQYVR